MTAQTHGFPELLELLGFDPDDAVTLCHQSRGGRFESRWTTAEKAPAVADDYPGDNVWFNVNELRDGKDSGRGSTADVTRLSALFADLDIKPGGLQTRKAAIAVVSDLSALLGTKPAAIIMSGHGYQPMWVLDPEDSDAQLDDDNRAAALALLRRFGRLVSQVAATRGGRVDSVFDLARVLRVPGTVNVKNPACPVPVKVAVCEDSRPLTVTEVDEVLDLYGAVERTGDRDQPGGEIVAPAADWTWSASTHPAVTRAVTSWSSACPKGRHPWLLGIATSLAFARRLGMVTEDDHCAAVTTVTGRFRWLLANQAPVRSETLSEVPDALAHGVNVVQRKSEVDAVADWTFWTDLVAGDTWTANLAAVELPAAADQFWDARPELAHVRQFARARLCSPLATLAVVLARVVTAVPHHYVLPPIIGGAASLNLFAAIVAPSGHGKGAAEAAARDAVLIDGITQYSLGSGEGIARAYGHRERVPDDNGRKGGSVIVRDHWALLFSVAEVDTLTALGARQGATLLPQVRQGFMGEPLGFAYADPHKAITIPAHEYRLCLVLGVQPGRAAGLLDEADGGTPQRFLWVPATDPGAPTEIPPAPDPMRWTLPTRTSRGPTNATGRVHLEVPQVARDDVVTAAQARNRGEVEALDGHALLTRLKVAAALALFAGRVGIEEDDWRLAGDLMDVSDRTRAGVVRYLSTRAEDANTARGRAEGQRAVVVSETVEAAGVRRAGQTILRHLRAHGESTWSESRRRLAAGLRQHFEAAVDALVTAGAVVVEPSERGQLLRLPAETR